MSYKVTILGKNYDLPPRTLSVDEGIEEMSGLDKRYESGEITRSEAVAKMHAFVESLAPGALPAVEEVDTNDLLKGCLDIIAAYDAPARKARSEARLAEVKDLMARPEIQKLMTVAKMKR